MQKCGLCLTPAALQSFASYAYLRGSSFLSQELLDKVLLGKDFAQD